MFLSFYLPLSFQERDAERDAHGGHKSRVRQARARARARREFREFLAASDFSQPREKIPRDRRIKHVRECRCPRRQMRRFTARGGSCVALYYSAIVVRHTRAVYLTHPFPRETLVEKADRVARLRRGSDRRIIARSIALDHLSRLEA